MSKAKTKQEPRVVLQRTAYSIEWRSSESDQDNAVQHKIICEQPTPALIKEVNLAWLRTEGKYLTPADYHQLLFLMEDQPDAQRSDRASTTDPS